MKVSDLRGVLADMPADADVTCCWDGCARTDAEVVWLSRGGYVVIAGFDDVVYKDKDRPKDAPPAVVEPYWRTRSE